jgi:hypothetical protein
MENSTEKYFIGLDCPENLPEDIVTDITSDMVNCNISIKKP